MADIRDAILIADDPEPSDSRRDHVRHRDRRRLPRVAVVRADEVGMFDGLASRDKDPRKSLHVEEVPTPSSARARRSSR